MPEKTVTKNVFMTTFLTDSTAKTVEKQPVSGFKKGLFSCLFLAVFLSSCLPQNPDITSLPAGASFGDARKAAASAAAEYECMEMDHPEDRTMTMECISREGSGHICYTFSENRGRYILDSTGCGQ